jgi:Uma2 family endonuclease
MATLTKPPQSKPDETDQRIEAVPNAHVFSLDGVSWEAYCALRDSLDANGRCNIRLTYDNGRLDLMSPGYTHEWPKMVLHAAVLVLSQEYCLPRRSLGSTTFRKEIEEKGFEPDQCYFLKKEKLVPFRRRPKRDLDIATVPPPDLTIEIDVTSSSVERLPLHAAWGVGEVWRVDDQADEVTILLLEGREYRTGDSQLFPGVTGAFLSEILWLDADDEDAWMDACRRLVRERFNPGERRA